MAGEQTYYDLSDGEVVTLAAAAFTEARDGRGAAARLAYGRYQELMAELNWRQVRRVLALIAARNAAVPQN